MSPLQFAAIAALVLRGGFFIATRRFRVRWYLAVLFEVLFLGGTWIWSGQLARPDLVMGTIALSATASVAITKMRGAWTLVALLLLLAQMMITYGLFMISESVTNDPGNCIWPGGWNEMISECDYF